MGQRANIELRYTPDSPPIYFYTHWEGYRTTAIVQAALAKRWRWTDDTYLARIIFCELIKGEEAQETGYGIGLTPAADANHPTVIVTLHDQTVTCHYGTFTFEEFIATPAQPNEF